MVAGVVDVEQEPQQPDREGERGELADDVPEVVPASRPPVRRHPPAVFLGRGARLELSAQSRFPYGSTNRIVVSSLVCWIAFAGSTPFGQTTEHSPTKLHSHTPSESASTGRRCPRP